MDRKRARETAREIDGGREKGRGRDGKSERKREGE